MPKRDARSRTRVMNVFACVLVSCLVALGCAHRAPQLQCMERFGIDSYRVGCWLWGDMRPGGGLYSDQDFEKLRQAGFNTFIGSEGDFLRLRKHGLKIMFGACKTQLPNLIELHKKYGANPDVLGYHLNDNCDLHDYTVECARWLLKNAPDKVPWMSTNPHAAGQAKVPMPVITSQVYTFVHRLAQPEEDIRIWFCNALERDRAHCNRNNMAMWPVIGVYAHGETPSQYRFQVNTAAAYGAQAVWLFAYNRYFRPVLNRAAGPANHYLTDIAGPHLLGRRSVAVFHTGPDLPGQCERPGPDKLITAMDDYMLAGVLVPDKKYRAGIDAPDYVMVVDKRTAKFSEGGKLGGWTGGHSDWWPRPEWVDQLIEKMYQEDPEPRQPRIRFGPRVHAVEALLPDGQVKRYELGADRAVQLPPLRGGQAVLLRIEAVPVKIDTNPPGLCVWTAPNKWKFSLDDKHVARQQNWADPAFDDKEWKEIFIDRYRGWEYQGYGKYLGDGWYRLRLAVPRELYRRYLYLHFGGADEESWVYIDGKLAFEHTRRSMNVGLGELWAAPFSFECSRLLADGKEHSFAVKVVNFWGCGGLHQPAHVVGADSPLNEDQLWRIIQAHEKGNQKSVENK